jgi:hypothetical protein
LEAVGTLSLTGAGTVGGAGTVALETNAVLGAACTFETANVAFLAGGHETLMLGKPASVTSTIAGFGASAGSAIDLLSARATGIDYTTLSSSSGVLTVSGTAGAIASLHFSGGSYHTSQFHYSVVGGSTQITFG